MALSDYGRNNTVSETCFRTLTHPLTNLICIIVAVSTAAFASVPTGIPPYVLAPIGFMLVILVDPAEIASRLKGRSARRGATVGRSEPAAGGWSQWKRLEPYIPTQTRPDGRSGSAEYRRRCKGTRGR